MSANRRVSSQLVFDDISAPADSPSYDIDTRDCGAYNWIFHCDFSNTGSVTMEGSLGEDTGWFTVITLSEGSPIANLAVTCAQIRFRCTAVNGTVRVRCLAPIVGPSP